MDPIENFRREVEQNVRGLGLDFDLQSLSRLWIREAARHRYTYNYEWLGRPIIQFPQDIVAIQEVLWSVKPDVVVETGIAHGGSLILSASILELLGGDGFVVGVDVDIRSHNREEIEKHHLSNRIRLVEGSSVDPETIDRVRALVGNSNRVVVILDSNHTHDHVLRELKMYSEFIRKDGYLIVLDTLIEDMPADLFENRPWGPGNNPKTAVWEFLKANKRFEIDKEMEGKLLITVAPDGFLKCVK